MHSLSVAWGPTLSSRVELVAGAAILASAALPERLQIDVTALRGDVV